MESSSEPEKLASVMIQNQSDHDKKADEVPEYLTGVPLFLLLFGLLIAVFTMAVDIAIVATGQLFAPFLPSELIVNSSTAYNRYIPNYH